LKEIENKTLLKQMVRGDIQANVWSDFSRSNWNNCFLFR